MSSSKSYSVDTSITVATNHSQWQNLEKEHQWLLKQIKKKRTELHNFVTQMRSLATEIFYRLNPIYHKMNMVDQEIHKLFADILSRKNLSKKNRKKVQKIYENLQMMEFISYQDFDDEDEELDELFEDSETAYNYEHQEHQAASQEIPSDNQTGKTPDSHKIRQIFLKLATIFHPDKVETGANHRDHTEIMKEINRAYREGDLAKLLEIERQYLEGETINLSNQDELIRRCEMLTRHNDLLKKQYENLKSELRLAKKTPEGAMVSDYRKSVKQGIDPIETMLAEINKQGQIIEQIRDFVRQFAEGKISMREFEEGPAIWRGFPENDLEAILEDLLDEKIVIIRS